MSNELIGQYVQGGPVGFGGLFRLPRAVGGGVVLCVSCLVDECSGVWAVDDVEWRPGGCLDVVLTVVVGGDEELVEEELVEHAADVFGGLPIGVSGVLGDVEGDRDEFVGFGNIGGEVAEAAVGGGQFGVEAFLFGSEHVDGDRVVVVGFEELALATFDGLFRGCPASRIWLSFLG